ncbi:DUF2243 domain-containing protein [Leptolyngbya ohadii]|uniref:DUF2243 domain-containing protein n=1 Tax=Leptolyngbya ohadii TaxID=1962290 RepID=UPI000B5A15B3|nr:DUF2243 domain-containing protein [Leptolyngbya ohadii]
MTINPPSVSSVQQPASQSIDRPSARPLITAGIVLGLGIGGFFDGIIFHQLLQWHHMFTSVETDMTVAGMEINTLGDGLFHLLDYIFVLIGTYLLWKAGRGAERIWSGKVLFGAILAGFGTFNLVEGVIDHHILGIHHLRSGSNELLWDLSFLAAGAILLGVGWLLMKGDPAGLRATVSDRAEAEVR